jgi:outer membrane protein TolC
MSLIPCLINSIIWVCRNPIVKLIIFVIIVLTLVVYIPSKYSTFQALAGEAGFESRINIDTKGPQQGPPIELTVKEAVLYALKNNSSLKIEQLKPSIKKSYEDEAKAAFRPTLNAKFSANQSKLSTGGITGVSKGTSTTTGVSILIPTGTQLQGEAELETDERFGAGVDLKVTQSILRGMGKAVNLANVQQARIDTFSSEYELRGFTEALASSVELAYWDLYLSTMRIDIYRDSLRLAEQQLEETRERIEVGVLAEIELAAAQAEVALRRVALIDATTYREIARLKLLRLLNPPDKEWWERDILLIEKPAPPDQEMADLGSHLEIASRMRPELNVAKLAIQRNELEVLKTKNGLLPKLDLFISLGKSGYAESFDGTFRDLGDDVFNIGAGVSFQYPLGMIAEKARYERSKLSSVQVEEALRNLTGLIELDVCTAYIEVNLARERIAATEASLRFQEEKLKAEMEKFRVGKSTALLVAQAQRDLLNSQIASAEAVVNYLKSLVNLYRLEGSLLERRGISVSRK